MGKGRRPGRPRCAVAHRAVLDAALALCIDTGYRSLSMQKIADRAGVGRQTLYRWWNSKADIVLEAFLEKTRKDIPVPDSGRVKKDLVLLIETSGQILEKASTPIVLTLLAEAALDKEFSRNFWDKFQVHRRNVLKTILTRGMERGELPGDLDLDFWADLVFGSLLYRLYSRNAPIDGAFGKALADLLPDKIE